MRQPATPQQDQEAAPRSAYLDWLAPLARAVIEAETKADYDAAVAAFPLPIRRVPFGTLKRMKRAHADEMAALRALEAEEPEPRSWEQVDRRLNRHRRIRKRLHGRFGLAFEAPRSTRRARAGRTPRPATNARVRGSRRTSSSSRTSGVDPGDDSGPDEGPVSSPSAARARRAVWTLALLPAAARGANVEAVPS